MRRNDWGYFDSPTLAFLEMKSRNYKLGWHGQLVARVPKEQKDVTDLVKILIEIRSNPFCATRTCNKLPVSPVRVLQINVNDFPVCADTRKIQIHSIRIGEDAKRN